MTALTVVGVVIAAVAAGVALWQGAILRRQLDNDLFIRKASFHQSVANLLRELDSIFLNNPELRPYFYHNKKPQGPLIEQKTMALAEYIMDLIECYTVAEKADPALLHGDWDDYFNYLYNHSYPMRRYWEDFGHLYPPDVRRALLGPSARPKPWPEHMKRGLVTDEEGENPSDISVPTSNRDKDQTMVGSHKELVTHPRRRVKMHYSEDQAANYERMDLKGSSFAISLLPAVGLLGDLAGSTVLDFGSGTGRSASALKEARAGRVLGVDNSENMLRAATKHPGVAYIQIGQQLPLKDASMDAALCANVLSEFSSTASMVLVCREIWRVLVPAAPFVIVVPNPESVSCNYISYRYLDVVNPVSGRPMTCLLKGKKPILIEDYYWTSDDYTDVLESAGFKVEILLSPVADDSEGDWLDETRVAPDLVIQSKRIDHKS